MTVPRGLVIGTAGHIDHGKTSLVRRLTGVDTDRLAEEKKRGISIDLGFAHFTLPNGCQVSFIDVPGHERFIKNMLAGATGIQAVLLIVAADESVKPQTREHFDICRFLDIQHGLIVLTKIDLASPEQIAIASEDVRILCAGSFLESAPILPVSAATGEGLDNLTNALADLASHIAPRASSGLARLPIDRSFAMRGFGTVVTGTLWDGTLQIGDTVYIQPGHRKARVRGLQVHGKQVELAAAGQRTAVNLSGVDHSEIRRGFVLTLDNGLEPSKRIDVSVDWLETAFWPERREQILLHLGTAEIPASAKILSAQSQSTSNFARLWLREPVLALPGDRFVLRHPSPARTVGGGVVIDAFPPGRLNRARTLLRLQSLAEADPKTRLEILVEASANGLPLADLVRMTGLPKNEIQSLIRQSGLLIFVDAAQRAVSKAWIDRQRTRILASLRDFHPKNPTAAGAPITQARLNMNPTLAAAVLSNWPAVRIEGDLIALKTHRAQVNQQDTQALSKIEGAFRRAGLQPPSPAEILRSVGMDLNNGRGLLEALIKTQKLVRISQDLIFHSEAVGHIRNSLAAHKGRRFSVPEFKEWTQISRKYAIPLLEYLDRQHVTRREGDARIVL